MYASRFLTPSVQCHAKIDKEALALTWACERFAEYLLGKPFHLHTDHKPLVLILSSKSLDTLPARVQCFHMCLMQYQFSISHVSGKDLHIVDALSRAPTSQSTPSDDQFCHRVDNVAHLVTGSLPVTEERLQQISRLQDGDEVCPQLKQYCLNGCSETCKIKLEDLIHSCSQYCKEWLQSVEPLIPTKFASLPWEKVVTDLFLWKGNNYLLVIDYLSRYIKIACLSRELQLKLSSNSK